jgi:hypothetical protein
MFSNNDIPVDALKEAALRPDILEAMQSFYVEVDRRIATHQPTCWNRGACCHFGEYGHRLYVTALEVIYYLSRSAPSRAMDIAEPLAASIEAPPASAPSFPILASPITADACPHAHDGQCHVRGHRPLGCRIFFCDPNAQQWQGPFTEECLEELKHLHRELGVPYFYTDWMTVLHSLQNHR